MAIGAGFFMITFPILQHSSPCCSRVHDNRFRFVRVSVTRMTRMFYSTTVARYPSQAIFASATETLVLLCVHVLHYSEKFRCCSLYLVKFSKSDSFTGSSSTRNCVVWSAPEIVWLGVYRIFSTIVQCFF